MNLPEQHTSAARLLRELDKYCPFFPNADRIGEVAAAADDLRQLGTEVEHDQDDAGRISFSFDDRGVMWSYFGSFAGQRWLRGIPPARLGYDCPAQAVAV